MIYELNGTVHWEVSREAMRALVAATDSHLKTVDASSPVGIELCNFRSALECELLRNKPAPTSAWD